MSFVYCSLRGLAGLNTPESGFMIPNMGIKKRQTETPTSLAIGIADALFSKVRQRVLGVLFGKAEFKGRILHWGDKLGVRVRMATVRPMRNKWASCSTAGNLHFNAELLLLDRKVGDYVIVHELLHFSVPNHGKLWKSLMRAHLGDYENLARQLPTRDARTD